MHMFQRHTAVEHEGEIGHRPALGLGVGQRHPQEPWVTPAELGAEGRGQRSFTSFHRSRCVCEAKILSSVGVVKLTVMISALNMPSSE